MTDKELREIRDWMLAPTDERVSVTGRMMRSRETIFLLLEAVHELKSEIHDLRCEVQCGYIWSHQAVLTPLHEKIEQLKAERQWISVKDRLPEDEDSVLCWATGCSIMAMETGCGLKNGPFAGWTHWMPMPDPPE